MQDIKLWKIENNSVSNIQKPNLDYEERLKKWLIEDISILSSNLLILGTEVITSFGKKIDILAINPAGELIIIELKRDKTYREIIAQVLDYATWVKDLDYEDINNIFIKYCKSEYNEISDYFTSHFEKEAEEIEFNSDHKMLILGSEIDDSTVRIIDYLSNEPYSVNINAVNFNYFKDENGKEYLARAFINPEVNINEESKSKKRRRMKSIITTLFSQNKLKINDKVFLKPAIDQGHGKEDVCAIIVNTNQNCLQWRNELYSFSKLRKIMTEEFNLKDIRKNWGFGVRFDWIMENGKSLSDLLEI